MKIMLSNQAFQWSTIDHSTTVAITGFDTGTIRRTRIVKSPAPSILADSSRLSGMVMKKLRMMISEKVGTRVGRTSAQIEFRSPSFDTSR